MNERQKRFVDFYIQTGNASEAARRAGYSERIANRIGAENLSKPVIRTAIDERLKELENHRVADTQENLERLTAIARGEVTEEVVTNTGKKVTVQPKVNDRIKATELLLKVQGAFREKVDVEVSGAEWFKRELEKVWENDRASP